MNGLKFRLAALGLLLALAGAASAQQVGDFHGKVLDKDGKPFVGVTIVITNDDSHQSWTVKTDKNGEYLQIGLHQGNYTFKLSEPKTELNYTDYEPIKDEGASVEKDFNFKEIIAKKGPHVDPEAEKKRQEEQAKFETMKQHFDAGIVAMNQARQLSAQVRTTPADQRAAIQTQLEAANKTAVTELEAARDAAKPDEPNLSIILANLGSAYESAGRHEDAAAAFQKASELKPTDPANFSGMATNLAYLGKVDDAGKACDKAAALNAATAPSCWRNIGIVLYKTNKVKEAIEPLKKATTLDPKNADGWYLLGASLLAGMEFKQEGDKISYIPLPGTAEAYQKYLDLAPNGPHAEECKAALEQLKALGQGVETKVNQRKKK